MTDDRVLLLTGASSGIGEATARRAAEAGYRLVLAARGADKLHALAAELGGNERAIAVPADVTHWDDNEAVVAAALKCFGRLDVVYANAGIYVPRGWLKSTPQHWREMVLTNVLGAAYTVRAAMPALIKSKGHVLISGSAAGRRCIAGSLYSVTKWAVTAMGESIRADLHGTGVRTTVIEPGGTETPIFDRQLAGRLEADDVARAVMYAISQPPHVNVNEILMRPTAQEH